MNIDHELSELHSTVGKKLRSIRKGRGEKIDAVAKSIDSDESTVSRIERGKYKSLNTEHLLRFCIYYGISLAELVSAEDTLNLNNQQAFPENKKGLFLIYNSKFFTAYFMHNWHKKILFYAPYAYNNRSKIIKSYIRVIALLPPGNLKIVAYGNNKKLIKPRLTAIVH
jgi:transcriptional regulator with XRE-family HTH domain